MSFYPYTLFSFRGYHSLLLLLNAGYFAEKQHILSLWLDPTQRAREKLHNWNGSLLRVDTILGLLYKLYFTRFV